MITRKMKNKETGNEITVTRWYILKNFWEYFMGEPESDGRMFGWVCGIYPELGYVDLEEISPYVLECVKGDQLYEIMPANGWEWTDN